MKFTNSFSVPLSLEETWKLVLDIPTVLPCLPGAELQEVVEKDKAYKGKVSVRLGPVKLAFEGLAEILEKDEANRIVYLKGSGSDPRGRGAAASLFNFRLKEEGTSLTTVIVETELELSGAIAQYGRGSGMIEEVASHIMKQFEANLNQLVAVGEHKHASIEDQNVYLGVLAEQGATSQTSQQGGSGVAVGSNNQSFMPSNISDVQAQALLAQAQATLAQTQALLLSTGLLGPDKGKKFKAAELNMFKIGMIAFWSRIKYMVKKPFSK